MRPISPYLSIYKPQVGSIFSIFGRISGLILFSLFIVYYLFEILVPFYFTCYSVYVFYFMFFKGCTLISLSILFFILINLFYHLLFSCRYIYWGLTGGNGNFIFMTLENVYKVAYWIIISICLISSIFWLVI